MIISSRHRYIVPSIHNLLGSNKLNLHTIGHNDSHLSSAHLSIGTKEQILKLL
jgi:hypothetical protein